MRLGVVSATCVDFALYGRSTLPCSRHVAPPPGYHVMEHHNAPYEGCTLLTRAYMIPGSMLSWGWGGRRDLYGKDTLGVKIQNSGETLTDKARAHWWV